MLAATLVLAAACLAGAYSAQKKASASAKVDVDFTRMNATMLMTQTYHLATRSKEFEGKTLRISGLFLTTVDSNDGKRYFGCLVGGAGGCSCCSPGTVLEFTPKNTPGRPNFPPVKSRITITGRLKMVKTETSKASFTIPCLMDATFER